MHAVNQREDEAHAQVGPADETDEASNEAGTKHRHTAADA